MDRMPLQILLRHANFMLFGMGLLVIASSIAVVYTAHVNRTLQNHLQTELSGKNRAQVEWGQLLLQHSTLTAPSRIDRLAKEELNMEVPGVANTIMVRP